MPIAEPLCVALLQKSNLAVRLRRLMCGSASRFRGHRCHLGLRPKLGLAQRSSRSFTEGQRPSAHRTAKPHLSIRLLQQSRSVSQWGKLGNVSMTLVLHKTAIVTCTLIIILTGVSLSSAQTRTYPDKIRGYKVERTVVEIKKPDSKQTNGSSDESDVDSLI